MNLYVTRHGKTDWNVQKKLMGRVDEPLNELGKIQSNEKREKLLDTKIDLIICSPLKRARETAEIINEGRNIPIIYDDRIIERDFGEFEGMGYDEFNFADYWDYYKNIEYKKAENIQVFFKRIYDFLDEILEEYDNKNVLIVTHAGVSTAIICYFDGNIPKETMLGLGLSNSDIVNFNKNVRGNNERYFKNKRKYS